MLTERIASRYLIGETLPNSLFHGTSMPRFKEMKERGETDLIYLAEEPDMARMYAEMAAQEDEEWEAVEAVIVEFDADTLLRNGELGPDYDDDVRSNLQLFDAVTVENVPWWESLEVLGTCTYRGSLGDAIQGHRTLG